MNAKHGFGLVSIFLVTAGAFAAEKTDAPAQNDDAGTARQPTVQEVVADVHVAELEAADEGVEAADVATADLEAADEEVEAVDVATADLGAADTEAAEARRSARHASGRSAAMEEIVVIAPRPVRVHTDERDELASAERVTVPVQDFSELAGMTDRIEFELEIDLGF